MGRASRKTSREDSRGRGPQAGLSAASGSASSVAAKLWGVPGLVLAGTVALLLYPPYFRGLFFTQEQLVTLLITLVVFGLWWAFKLQVGDLQFFASPLDYFALAAALAWTLSIVVAVNPRGAVQEALQNLDYFLLYWLVAEQVRSRHSVLHRKPRPILGALYVSALGVALMGLGAAAGLVHYNGAFAGDRIASTIQYPNSLAAYLTAAFYVGLGLWVAAPDADAAPVGRFRRLWGRIRTGAFAATAAVILLTFIYTLSRGAWLVFPFALVLFVILAGAGHRLRAVSYFAATFIAALAALPFMAAGIGAARPVYIELAVLLALVLGAGLGYVAELYLRRSVRWKVTLAAGLAVVLVAAVGAVFGLAAARPLTLGHPPVAPDGWETLEQGITGLDPSAESTLTFEVNATGDANKPYAWRAAVYGYDPGTGASKLLANLVGKPTSGWQAEQVKIAPAAGLTRVTLQLGNFYAGTQATFRNVTVQSAAGAVVARPGFILARVLPNSVYAHIKDISLGAANAESRFGFDADALKIVRDRPLLGLGGAGWASAYKKYQSYGYISSEVHNHFLQTWVDSGTVGFLAWLGLWGAFIFLGLRLVRSAWGAAADGPAEGRDSGLLLAGVLAAAGAMGIHSFIDFDLSLGAISLYLWALMGLVTAASSRTVTAPSQPKGGVRQRFVPEAAVPLVVVALGLFFGGRLLVGFNAMTQAARLMNAGQSALAQNAYRQAIAYDPWTASSYVDLGQLDHSIAEVQHGIALDPYNPRYHQLLGTLYIQQNKATEGLAELDSAIALEPFQQQAYQQVAGLEYAIAEGLIRENRRDLAQPFLEKVVALGKRAADRAREVPQTAPAESRLDATAPALALSVGKAAALLGNRTDAMVSLAQAMRGKDTAPDADVWLAALFTLQKAPDRAAPYLALIKTGGKQMQNQYANVYSMLMSPS